MFGSLTAALASTLVVKIVEIALVAILAIVSYQRQLLNASGSMVAFVMGTVIVAVTNILWLIVLVSLLAMGSLATRYRYGEKEARKVAEENKGRRRSRNVVANGLTPTILAAASPLIAAFGGHSTAAITYIAAIAVASSDTVASEVGSLSNRVFLITTFQAVPPGTDGGVSRSGQLAALVGAVATSAVGYVLLAFGSHEISISLWSFAIPAACGFVGCQVDSVLGATLETKGLVTKEEVNLLSITAGAGLALILALFIF
ncbi:MAG: DUF92 domain-containing protein [Thermoplasmatota archaeon]